MKNIRKRIAWMLLFVFCISNSVSALAAEEPQKEKQSPTTTLHATVAPASASYYVEIPAEVSLGTLNAQQDMIYPYSVSVTMHSREGTGQVTVSSDEQIALYQAGEEKNAEQLPCYNSFRPRSFDKSGSAEGKLTIHKENIAQASPGQYSGVLNFYMKYQGGTMPHEDPDSPVTPTEPNVPVVPPDEILPPENVVSPPQGTDTDGAVRYVCDVSMRKGSDFSSVSMCNKLFYKKADIVCKGDTATVTLYVIDPIPSFASAGTPLSNVRFQYGGKAYGASIKNGSKVMKTFNVAAGFIPKAGEYATTPVSVSLPMQAIKDSLAGKLTCSAYINAVMNTTQSFYVVLSNLVQVSSPPPSKPADMTSPDALAADPTAPAEIQPDSGKTDFGVNSAPTGETAQQIRPTQYRIVTKLFPKILVFGLATVLVLGGAFWGIWLHDSRKK